MLTYKTTIRGSEVELEIDYDYDFEHRHIENDSLTISYKEVDISLFINDVLWIDIYQFCLDHELSKAKNKPIKEDDGRY